MALWMSARVRVILLPSLFPLLIVGVKAYDSLWLSFTTDKPLEVDPHPPFRVNLKVVDSLEEILDTGLSLK